MLNNISLYKCASPIVWRTDRACALLHVKARDWSVFGRCVAHYIAPRENHFSVNLGLDALLGSLMPIFTLASSKLFSYHSKCQSRSWSRNQLEYHPNTAGEPKVNHFFDIFVESS